MIIWIDPPLGYLYGFPKLWDQVAFPDLHSFLLSNGYDEIDYNTMAYIRVWNPTSEEIEEYERTIGQRV